jgi:hypothetical protein
VPPQLGVNSSLLFQCIDYAVHEPCSGDDMYCAVFFDGLAMPGLAFFDNPLICLRIMIWLGSFFLFAIIKKEKVCMFC